jgi:hypothetical protein
MIQDGGTMRHTARALLVVLSLGSAAARAENAFPLPSPDGKPLARTANQRVFRVPLGFARVEAFYRQQLGTAKDVTLLTARGDGGRTLTISSRRPTDAWARAVVRESAVETIVEVTPTTRFAAEVVEGRGKPLVELVLPPDVAAVRQQANSIDHTPRH